MAIGSWLLARYSGRIQRLLLGSATVLLSERVKSLESIEIEPFMVEAASQGYRPKIHQVFEDPRSRIVTYLKPGGLLVQWLQIYETDMSIIASIVTAMSKHFAPMPSTTPTTPTS
jgi:tricorn protease-like protein